MPPSFAEPLEPRRVMAATLTVSDVRQILAQAASQTLTASMEKMVIAVVDRDANILGVFGRSGLDKPKETGEIALLAVARARTAALFQSRENAFTTRSARFIIQDHFPQPIRNTVGGPLYGVQFSSLLNGDVTANAPGISGDPGGIPLYRDGEPIGGIGVAGDFSDTLARPDLDGILDEYAPTHDDNDDGRPDAFNGREESDLDESVALAGAVGYMAPDEIRANHVSIDGLALPFTANKPRAEHALVRLSDLSRRGFGNALALPTLGKPTDAITGAPASPYPRATYAGIAGLLKRQDLSLATQNYNNLTSNDRDTFGSGVDRLTVPDVNRIIERAVREATHTRAGIRLPVDKIVRVHVTVVDRDGDLLGVFAMDDATNFSYDVAVQKARTAAFFSDDDHAFSTRAIGTLSQQFFPIGVGEDNRGPLYHVQNGLSPGLALSPGTRTGAKNPLKNGITVFPGGVPLYKNGHLVGAIGISGDGVDQDDRVAFAGAGPMNGDKFIRSDALRTTEVRDFITARAQVIFDLFGRKSGGKLRLFDSTGDDVSMDDVRNRFDELDFRLPYVKFPRNPEI